MNRLPGSDVYVENKLFSTLDTRTRQWQIPEFGKVLLSDTVGFIRDLPHHLVASFKATLEEVRQARLLLHVVDASNPLAEEHIKAVNLVLEELECDKKPSILVLNKVDKVTDLTSLDILRAHHPKSVTISGLTGEGVTLLTDSVVEKLASEFIMIEVVTTAGNGKLLAYLNSHTDIFHQEFHDSEVLVRCHLPRRLLHAIKGEGVKVKLLEREPAPEVESNHID
jgi:GTP-binding protein HflX